MNTKMTFLTAQWKQWVNENLGRGCSPKELAHMMMHHGFSNKVANYEVGLESIDDDEKDKIGLHYGNLSDQAYLISSSYGVNLYKVDHVFSQEQCENLCENINSDLMPSRTSFEQGEYKMHRTSQTSYLGQVNKDVLNSIDATVCSLVGIDTKYSEPIQAQSYEKGQEFKLHTDYFESSHNGFDGEMSRQGQRTVTVIVFLRKPEKGGGTEFPDLGVSITPEVGSAIIWCNLNPQGQPIPQSLHCGKPVIKGDKTIITKWFRQKERPF